MENNYSYPFTFQTYDHDHSYHFTQDSSPPIASSSSRPNIPYSLPEWDYVPSEYAHPTLPEDEYIWPQNSDNWDQAAGCTGFVGGPSQSEPGAIGGFQAAFENVAQPQAYPSMLNTQPAVSIHGGVADAVPQHQHYATSSGNGDLRPYTSFPTPSWHAQNSGLFDGMTQASSSTRPYSAPDVSFSQTHPIPTTTTVGVSSLGPANQTSFQTRNSVAMNQQIGSTHQTVPTIVSAESTGTTSSSPHEAVNQSPTPPHPLPTSRTRLYRRNGRCPNHQSRAHRCRRAHLLEALAMDYKGWELNTIDWEEGQYLAKGDMEMVGQHLLRCKQEGCQTAQTGFVFTAGSSLYRHLLKAHGLKKTPRRRRRRREAHEQPVEDAAAEEVPEWETIYRSMTDENKKLLALLGCTEE